MSWWSDLLARLRGAAGAAPQPPPDDALLRQRLADALAALGAPDVPVWTDALAGPCRIRAIDTPPRLAAFLAQCAHESAGFRRLRESLDYTPQALRATWPARFDDHAAQRLGRLPGRPADQRGIAEIAYGGRLGNGPPGSGDGWRFRGAGIMQITGRANCSALSASCGVPTDEVPDWLAQPAGAAWGAAWFWATHNLNALADAGAFDQITRVINGGTHGAEDRRRRWQVAKAALGL